MKFNVLDNIKKIFIGFVSLVLVAIIILSIFGLNLGPELNGYIEIKADIGQINVIEKDEIKEHTNRIKNILQENGAKILQTNTEDSGFDSVLVIIVKNVSKERTKNIDFANNLETLIEENYNDELFIVHSRVVSAVMTNTNVVTLAYVLLISIIIGMIYLVFRIKLLNTICVLASTLTSVVLFVSLITITRVQLNLNIFGIVLLLVFLSMMLSSFKLADIKNSRIDTLTKNEVGKLSFSTVSSELFVIIIVAMCCLIAFGTLIVKSFAICVILALICVWLAENMVCMPLCYYLNNYTIAKVKPEVVEENKDAEAEQVNDSKVD